MTLTIFRSLLFFCLASVPLKAAEITDHSTGVSFPETVSFNFQGNQYNLAATGVATRKKFFVKVYSVASYLQKGAFSGGDIIDSILNDQFAKQLTMKWTYNVDASKMQNGYLESFKSALSDSEFREIGNEIN